MAFINQTIHDSLQKPLRPSDLRFYPKGLGTDTTEYQTIRQNRKVKFENEAARVGAQKDIMKPYFSGMYRTAYKEDISGLRKQLKDAWEHLERVPSKSAYYIKMFNAKRGKR